MKLKKLSQLIIIALLVVLCGCITKKVIPFSIISEGGKVEIDIEIADDPKERSKGLMYRKSLPQNSGMLFIFENERNVSFWMKNTLIPLDMIFIAENGTITEIKQNIQPCESDPCESYPSNEPTKYVLEVNANFSKENNIQVGDKLEWNN